MTNKFENTLIPVKSWTDFSKIDELAMQQLKNCASLPFAFKRVVALPDVHAGIGISIGTVLALENVIIPNAIGVDQGCGMCAVKTSLTSIDKETLKSIMSEIRKVVPLGFNKHKAVCDFELMPDLDEHKITENNIVWKEFENARKQLGSLGSGNHFIEIQKGDDGHVWIMIHSGSRNLGNQVAKHYDNIARELNKKWHSKVDDSLKLAFLPVDTKEGQDFLTEMQYCVNFALANRKLMMDRIKEVFIKIIHEQNSNVFFDEIINIAHNYAKLENHFGENVWVHRKGATLATDKTIGIIPGSQGTSSYIVKGKGNLDSFTSCSHGAGRTMSRSKAKETLDLHKERQALDDKGILHTVRDINSLDEAPGSYKNIDVVMEEQKDLVEILVKLEPLAVIKG